MRYPVNIDQGGAVDRARLGDYSDINITRELSGAEQNEYQELADKQKQLTAAIEKIRQEMFADGVDESTREKMEKKYRSASQRRTFGIVFSLKRSTS